MYPYKDYTRVGGWLLVFVIWSILQILINVALGIETLTVLPVSSLFAIVGHGCARTAMLILLLRRNRNCMKLLIAEAVVFVAELIYTVAIAVQQGTDIEYLLGTVLGSVFGSAVFYIGWLLYFQRSVRMQAFFSGVNPMPPYGPYGGYPPYGYGAPYPPQDFSAPPPAPDGTVRYCPRCGRPVTNPASLFCAGCGAPLRREGGDGR